MLTYVCTSNKPRAIVAIGIWAG